MREATPDDLEFCAEAMIRTGLHMTAEDPYSANLPRSVRDEERDYARGFIGSEGRLALIEEEAGVRIAVLLAEITASKFRVAVTEPVGYIAIGWVAESARRRGVMRRMLEAADLWFVRHGATLVELSYLSANRLAGPAWHRLGFEPFRVQAYRRIDR